MIFKVLALLIAAFFGSSSAFAQSVASSNAFDKFMWTATGGSSQTVGFSSTGTPVLTPGATSINLDGGLPRVNVSGTLSNPAGKAISVSAVGRVSAAQTRAAIGRFMGKTLPLLSTGYALYDLGKELGFTISSNSGTLSAVKSSGSTVSTAPTCASFTGVGQYIYNSGDNYTYGTFPVNSSTGAPILPAGYISNGSCTSYSSTTWQYIWLASNGWSYWPVMAKKLGNNLSDVPSTYNDFLDAVAVKSGWPATSAIAKALELSATVSGVKVPVESVTVTGPATSTGKVSTATNPASNTTTTNTTTYNHTYEGAKITTNTVTTTNVTNNTTGVTTTQQQTTEEQPVEVPPTDSALPDFPKLYEPKYPGGISGVWTARKAELDASPLLNLLSRLMPTGFNAGTCPRMVIPLDVGIADFGSHDVAPPCWVWDFAKVVIIVSALLLARALVFGG